MAYDEALAGRIRELVAAFAHSLPVKAAKTAKAAKAAKARPRAAAKKKAP